MKRTALLSLFTTVCLACAVGLPAQEGGDWRASSTTAKGITGDIAIANEKILIDFYAYPLAQIRALRPAEVNALFNPDPFASSGGNLYRVSIPAEKKFLHKNTLCGSDDTQWVATYVEGRTLHLALLSGTQMPVFTPEVLANATSLCGTFSYVR